MRFLQSRSGARAIYCALALVGVGCAGATLPRSSPANHELLGTTPSPLEGEILGAGLLALPVSGQITVLDFWSTSCEPCLRMMPELEVLHRDFAGRGVKVVGIAADDNPGLVLGRLKAMKVSYPSLLDGQNGRFQGRYLVSKLPTTIIVDRAGRVRVVLTGGDDTTISKVRAALSVLLREEVHS